MSKKAKALLYELIECMQGNGWSDDDIKDFLGKPTLKPKSFPSSMLYEITSLYYYWLKIKMDGGYPREIRVLEDIANLTVGERARHRQEKLWRDEQIKVFEIKATQQPHGPSKGWDIINLRLSSCNLRCPNCTQMDTWEGGITMTTIAIESLILKLLRNEQILVVNGGEPLLWMDKTSLLRMLYKWGASTKQIHLETNGTMFPQKIFRDVFGLITVSPNVLANPEYDYWKPRIKWWEDKHPPIWAPFLPEDKGLQGLVKELLFTVEPDRVWPRGDPETVKDICSEMSWRFKE